MNLNQQTTYFSFEITGSVLSELPNSGEVFNAGFNPINTVGTSTVQFTGGLLDAGCGNLVDLSLDGEFEAINDIIFLENIFPHNPPVT